MEKLKDKQTIIKDYENEGVGYYMFYKDDVKNAVLKFEKELDLTEEELEICIVKNVKKLLIKYKKIFGDFEK